MDTHASRRKPRGFKIALIVIAGLLFLFAAGLYFLPYFLPVGTIKNMANAEAARYGLHVDFASLGFGWNGSVVLEDVAVSPIGADGNPAEPIATVGEIRTSVSLPLLLSGKAVVNSIIINDVRVAVVRDESGRLNLPDPATFPDAAAPAAPEAPAEAEAGAFSLPAVLAGLELHRLEINNAVASLDDRAARIQAEAALDFFTLEGGLLNDPFVFSGRFLPYPAAPAQGEIPFTGRAALVKDFAFNPDGEATLDVTVNNFSLAEAAAKFGLGSTVPAGVLDGEVKAAYANRQGIFSLAGLRLSSAELGTADGRRIALPETVVDAQAVLLPDSGTVNLNEFSLAAGFLTLRGQGVAEGLPGLADGGLPAAALDFTGTADFSQAAELAASLGQPIPFELSGTAAFTGRAALPRPESPGAQQTARLDVTLDDGSVAAANPATGVEAGVDLAGLALRSTAVLAAPVRLNATVTATDVPVRLVIPALSPDPVTAAINGGVAVAASGDGADIELRLANTRAALPATAFSTAAEAVVPETRITYSLKDDTLSVQSLQLVAGNAVRAGITQGVVTGVTTGQPTGQAVIDCAGDLTELRALLTPAVPPAIASLAGTFQTATRLKLAGGIVEAASSASAANLAAAVDVDSSTRAEASLPAASGSAVLGVNIASPDAVTLSSLSAQFDAASLRYAGADGLSASGQTGAGQVTAAGRLTLSDLSSRFTNLAAAASQFAASVERDGRPTARLTSAALRVTAATPEAPLAAPVSGTGDFSLAGLALTADGLVFQRLSGEGAAEEAAFGNVAAKLAAAGYIGPDKPQIITISAASLSSAPLVVNSQARADLGSGAAAADYAARVNPAGLAPLLAHFNLPPAILADLAASGSVAYDGSKLEAKGQTQGQIRLVSGEINPFAAAHDFTAAHNASERSLTINLNRLEGQVRNASGDAVATLAAQKSELFLSRAGSRGGLDIRVSGSAAPTRQLALGLVGMIPQLGDAGNVLNSAVADGTYNAWLRVTNTEHGTLALNCGGIWQNATLSLGGTPFVAEPGKLSAAVEGEFAHRDNIIRLSRMILSSEGANVSAEGAAQVQLAADADHAITGLGNVGVNLRFGAPDLARAAQIFPGMVPADMGLAGALVGAFQASGAVKDIQVRQAAVQFQSFSAMLGGSQLTIPQGAATFTGGLALNLDAPTTGAEYDSLRMINVTNGAAGLTGASLAGKAVDQLAANFELIDGVLDLQSLNLTVGGGAGGSLAAAGRVDFTQAAPAVDVRFAAKNMPLALANSEIESLFKFESGTGNLPASGDAARVSFTGLAENEILRSVRLENFNFATGPVELLTGSVLNAELDRARGLMHQEVAEGGGKERRVTFQTITGGLDAAGDGVIHFSQANPVNVIGENTGDFRIRGSITADHTMDIQALVVGKIDNLVGFTLPNLIPNLRSGTDEERNRFMARMNENAAREHYGVNITGSLDNPDLSGIGLLAAQFLKDIFLAAPQQIIGGVLDLGKDAPGTILDAAGAILGAPGAIVNDPSSVLRTPENIGRGLGRMFGLGGAAPAEGGQEQQQQQQQQQQQGQGAQETQNNIGRGLGRMFGLGGGAAPEQSQQQHQGQGAPGQAGQQGGAPQQQQQQQGGGFLPFLRP